MTTLDLDALERAARAAICGDPMINARERAAGRIALKESATPEAILSLISDYRALQERVGAAEKALEFYRDGFQFHPKRGPTGIDHSVWKPRPELLDDCGNVAVDYFAARTKAGEPHA